MDIHDENDNGIENTLVDPFATVSTEAFPLPIEDYIPSDTIEVDKSDEQTIPTLDSDGAVEFHDNLKALLEEKETAEELTDTPQQPLPEPDQGDEETRVSFEVDDTEIKTDLLLLEELVEVHERLKTVGGICKEDVYQVESLVPGLLTTHRKLNAFSVIPTPVSLGVSMESIQSKIKTIVLKLLSTLIDHVIQFGKWLAQHLVNLLKDKRDLQEVRKQWNTVLEVANRVDGVNGRDAFKRRYPDESLAKKASTNTHYITLVANQLLKEKGLNSRKGFKFVESGSLYADVKEQLRGFKTWQQSTGQSLYKIEKDGGVDSSSVNKNHVGQRYATLKAEYAEPSSTIIREIIKAVNIKDGIHDTRDDIRSIDKFVKDFTSTLQSLEKKYQGQTDIDTHARDNIKYLQAQFDVMKTELKIVDLQLNQFQGYYKYLGAIVSACERKIRTIDLTTR